MNIRLVSAVVMLVLGVGIVIAAAPQQKPSSSASDVLMGTALHQEEVEGNLEAAIATYKKVIADARASRALKASALLRLGRSYEKLGDAEAGKAYERLAREFADQVDSAAQARTHLAALTLRDGTAGPGARQVWEDALAGAAAISPDGRHLVYVGGLDGGRYGGGNGALYVRDLRSGLTRRLTMDSTNNTKPVVSPDGKLVAYGWSDGVRLDLRLVTLDGSAPPAFHQSDDWDVISPHAWSADGKQILALGRHTREEDHTNILLVSVADGSVRLLKAGPPNVCPQCIGRMSLSSDGRYLVYDYHAQGDSGQRDIFILPTGGGPETRLVTRPSEERYPFFTPDGTGVLFLSPSSAGGSIGAWHQRIADGKPQGSPVLLKADLGQNPIPIGFTTNGSFHYQTEEPTVSHFVATLDPTNGTLAVQPSTFTQRVVTFGSGWSPDGQYLAYGSRRTAVKGAAGAGIMVIRSLVTGEEREIAPALSNFSVRPGGWSPDGRSLLARGTDNAGRTGLYRVDARTGDIAHLLDGIPSHFNWFLNGKALVFIRGGAIVQHDLVSGRDTELYRPTAPTLLGSCVVVSDDSQRLAFYIRDSGTQSTSLMVMGPGEKPRQVGPTVQYPERIFDLLALTPGGQHVIYNTFNEQVGKVWRVAVNGGAPQEIGLSMGKLGYIAGMSVHPDGQRIVFGGEAPLKRSVWALENFLPKARAAR